MIPASSAIRLPCISSLLVDTPGERAVPSPISVGFLGRSLVSTGLREPEKTLKKVTRDRVAGRGVNISELLLHESLRRKRCHPSISPDLRYALIPLPLAVEACGSCYGDHPSDETERHLVALYACLSPWYHRRLRPQKRREDFDNSRGEHVSSPWALGDMSMEAFNPQVSKVLHLINPLATSPWGRYSPLSLRVEG